MQPFSGAHSTKPSQGGLAGFSGTSLFGYCRSLVVYKRNLVALSRERRLFHPRVGDRINADGTVSVAFLSCAGGDHRESANILLCKYFANGEIRAKRPAEARFPDGRFETTDNQWLVTLKSKVTYAISRYA